MKNREMLTKESEGKLFHFRFVLFAAIYLAIGVAFCFYFRFREASAAWLLCLLPLAAFPVFLSFPFSKWKSAVVALCSLCVCFFIGFFGFMLQANRYEDIEISGEYYFSGRVVELHKWSGSVKVVLDDVTIEGERQNCKLIAYLPASFADETVICDVVFLHGNIQKREMDTEEFSLVAKDFGKRIFLSASGVEGYKTGRELNLFLFLNARAKTVIDRGMDETTAAVTTAVLLGDTSGIEADLYENIRRGGVAHIFAVSGLHVGALFGACLLAIKKTPLGRLPAWARLAFVSFVLIAYAGICAFTASVLRATVICLIAYVGKLLQVKTDFLQSLGAAAFCILIFRPSALFTVGFQLSFAACLGFTFLAKPIGQVFDELAKYYRKLVPIELTEAEIEAIKNDDTVPPRVSTRMYRAASAFFAMSLGTQIFTAPLLLYYFGYVSGWALLLNCIFVPLISAIFSLLLLSVAIACVLPLAFSPVVLYPPRVIWSALLLLFEGVDFTSFALEGLSISVGLILVYWFAVLFFTDKWNVKKSVKFIFAFACILAFVVGMVALNV